MIKGEIIETYFILVTPNASMILHDHNNFFVIDDCSKYISIKQIQTGEKRSFRNRRINATYNIIIMSTIQSFTVSFKISIL